MQLVGYGRVSTTGQRENSSLGTQKEAIQQYCDQFGHDLIAYYEDVESGATIEKRENFQWALTTVCKAADGLVVLRLDRLTRSVLDAERLKITLAKQGKILLSVFEPMDLETDDGEFIYTINSAIAQLERKRIVQRAKRGRAKKFEEGGYHAGQPPYGYIPYRGTLMELPAEQEIIRMIREMHFVAGDDCVRIAEYLNAQGILSKRRMKWSSMVVRRLISGDPPSIVKLRENGKLLTEEHWKEVYGAHRTTRQHMDATRNEEAS